MNDPQSIVSLLEKKFGCFAIHNIEVDPAKGDVDIYCPEEKLAAAEKLLQENGFVTWFDEIHRLQAERFSDNAFFNLHLYADEGFAYYWGVGISKEFRASLKIPADFQTLEYLTFRTLFFFKSKYLSKLAKDQAELEKELFFIRHLEKNPFSRKISFDDFSGVVKKSPLIMLTTLRLSVFWKIFSSMLALKLKNNGRIIALAGVDGSGKSTLIEKIPAAVSITAAYMGARQFKLVKIHAILERLGKPGLAIRFFLCWLEQWARYIRIILAAARGRTVLIDRFPKYESFLYPSKAGNFLDNLLYGILFPDVSELIVVTCPVKQILSRKDEGVSEKDLESLQNRLVAKAGKRHRKTYSIVNEDLDSSLNNLLSIIRNKSILTK